jgi:hypothetical protein
MLLLVHQAARLLRAVKVTVHQVLWMAGHQEHQVAPLSQETVGHQVAQAHQAAWTHQAAKTHQALLFLLRRLRLLRALPKLVHQDAKHPQKRQQN